MLKPIAAILLGLLVLIGVNHLRVNAEAQKAVRTAEVMAYYRWGVTPNVIVFDIHDLEPTASAASVIGDLIRFAGRMRDREFDAVHLAWRGETRFILPGRDFSRIGREVDFQNPVYTVRTLPEQLLTPAGVPAFSQWTGGVLGVLGRQMDDVNTMAAHWFINDAIASFR